MKALGNDRGHLNIHRPGKRRIFLRAEFPTRHKYDIVDLRQRRHRVPIKQIAGYRLHAAALKTFAQALFVETGNANDALLRRGIARKPRQGRTDFAADTEHHDVAVNGGEIGRQNPARPAHKIFQVVRPVEAAR